VLIATRGGEIFELDKNTNRQHVYMRGHFNDELWGLAVHPSLPQVYTWGRDALLAIWDMKTRR
jgi:microtubule-associated protein-like 6